MEWDYRYEGKPAAKDLPYPFGTSIMKKGDVRRAARIGTDLKLQFGVRRWTRATILTKRWTEFLNA